MLGLYALGAQALGGGPLSGGPSVYTLYANNGAYSVNGQAATLYRPSKNLSLNVSVGSYSVNGQVTSYLLYRILRYELPFVYTSYVQQYYAPVPLETYNSVYKNELYTLIVKTGTRNMAQLITFPQIGPNQQQTMGVDFGQLLPTGVTLTGTPVLTMSVVVGTDAAVSSRIITTPTIGSIPTVSGGTGLASTAVTWQVGGCLTGVTYQADIYCYTATGDRVETFVRFACGIPS